MTTATQVVKSLLSLLLGCTLRGPIVVLFMCVDLKESERKGVIHFEAKTVFFQRDLLGEGKAEEVTGVANDWNEAAWCAVLCHLLQPCNLLPSPSGYFYLCILILC